MTRLLAFYLPQFYPTPTNDANWGKGFTEWSNVARAIPHYAGHQQPRLPADLGFYDLRRAEVMHEQAALAKDHGLDGFCFYYYRFDGRRELNLPLDNYIAPDGPDFPFCICWANEPWTRNWDGQNHHTLIPQTHNDQDDVKFIEEFIEMARQDRYIKVDGRPLLLIYRPELWQDIVKTTRIWREKTKAALGVDLYLVYCNNCFKRQANPQGIGFDAAYQFPPHMFGAPNCRNAIRSVRSDYGGNIMRFNQWRTFVKDHRDFKLFRGVMPSWDNTPRKMGKGGSFFGASPQEYKEWLIEAMRYTVEHLEGDEQLVFINAWNEWAEGAILEPCKVHGLSYLEATRDAKNVG